MLFIINHKVVSSIVYINHVYWTKTRLYIFVNSNDLWSLIYIIGYKGFGLDAVIASHN
jgi:hypothetical protein